MTNRETFEMTLAVAYKELFEQKPQYAFVSSKHTPEEMASKITNGIIDNTAMWNGDGVKKVCKILNLRCSKKAIVDYLTT